MASTFDLDNVTLTLDNMTLDRIFKADSAHDYEYLALKDLQMPNLIDEIKETTFTVFNGLRQVLIDNFFLTNIDLSAGIFYGQMLSGQLIFIK